MVLNTEGLNRIRDLIEDDVYKVQAGTGTTSPMVSNTGLETPVASTQNNPTLQTTDQQLTITNTILSTQGNSSSLSEAICELGDVTTQYNLFRVTFNPLSKVNTEEHIHITRVFLRNNL
jgi:ubiquinone biosynthesis protein Coq4